MQANRIVSFFKLTQFFIRIIKIGTHCGFVFAFFVVCFWVFSLSVSAIFFVSTDVKFKQKNDSKGCNAFGVCSTLYLQPRGVFTGLPK